MWRVQVFMLAVCVYVVESGVVSECHTSHDVHYNGTRVVCSHMHLQAVPANLPRDTCYLDLSHNNISTVGESLQTLFNLRYLDLSSNSIEHLSDGDFKGLGKTDTLFINGNQLKLDSYPKFVFKPLLKLRVLHMQNNDLSDSGSYPDDVIATLGSVQELKIDSFTHTKFGRGFTQMRNLKILNFGFQGCKMFVLKNETFEVFEKLNVSTLNLQYCPLMKVGKNALWPFQHLQSLIMSNAISLSPPEAVKAMYGLRGKRLKLIQINRIYQLFNFRIGVMNERILDRHTLSHLAGVCVERFEMIDSKLTWIDSTIITGNTTFSRCIRVMDMSNNELIGDPEILLELSHLPQLESINVAKGHSAPQVKDKMIDICHKSNIRILITLPLTLTTLITRGIGNSFGCVHDVIIHNSSNLKYADFSYLGIEGKWERIVGLGGLEYLDISGNNFGDLGLSTFAYMPRLKTVIMSNVQVPFGVFFSKSMKTFSPLRNLSQIDLSYNDLKIMDREIFKSNKMNRVDLSNNGFQHIPFDLETTPDLEYLDISFNNIPVLTRLEMETLDTFAERNNFSLNLDGNLLACGCSNLDFVEWVYTTKVHFTNSVVRQCLLDNGSLVAMDTVFNDIDHVWRSCNGAMYLAGSISVFSLIVLVMTSMYITHSKKTWLLNVTLRLFGLKGMKPVLTRGDFKNDCYICYCSSDYQYVCHDVRKQLEGYGLKLFITERDTIPGNVISHEIIRGIDSSWKCIVLLTKAFLEDEWSGFSIDHLVYVHGKRSFFDVILVLCDDVKVGHISPSLLNVVNENRIFRTGLYRNNERLWKDVNNCVQIIKETSS